MPSILKTITAAAAIVAMGSAHATIENVPAWQSVYLSDPTGSGRVAELGPFSGSGLLTFNNVGADPSSYDASSVSGAVGTLNTWSATLSSSGGMAVQEQWKSYASSGLGFESVYFGSRAEADADPLNEPYIASGELKPNNLQSFRLASAVGAPVSSFSIKTNALGESAATSGAAAGSFMTVPLAGQLSIEAPRNVAQTGGRVDIQNLVVDLYNGKVNAEVSGTRYAFGKFAAVDYSPENITLWTFNGVAAGGADLAGPTGVSPEDWLAVNNVERLTNPAFCGNRCFSLLSTQTNAYGYSEYAFQGNTTISNLTMTQAGAAFIGKALNSTPTGMAALNGVNYSTSKWGSLTLNITIGQVPEPGTYALMGLGLVGISLVARQRRQPA